MQQVTHALSQTIHDLPRHHDQISKSFSQTPAEGMGVRRITNREAENENAHIKRGVFDMFRAIVSGRRRIKRLRSIDRRLDFNPVEGRPLQPPVSAENLALHEETFNADET
jgi:hypothetical protein